jgi:hypothetical protein
VFANSVVPPLPPVVAVFPVPPTVAYVIWFPAVAVLIKRTSPHWLEFAVVATVCVTPESLVTPAPLMVRISATGLVIVYALALELNTIPSTSVFAVMDTSLFVDWPKVAVSAKLLGTVAGLQFAIVSQSPEIGLVDQIELPAKAWDTRRKAAAAAKIRAGGKRRARQRGKSIRQFMEE